MTLFEIIGLPFDGFGREGRQALAPGALREAGLARAFTGHQVDDTGEIHLPQPDPRRGSITSLVNENALITACRTLADRVPQAVAAGRVPVVVGGDCSSLLGTVPGLRAAIGPVGLVFVDGHEDTMPLDVSEDGEAANTEIGLLLGLTGRLLTGPLGEGLPALDLENLAVLGPRDLAWRQRFNVGSLADHGAWLRPLDAVALEPARSAREAVRHVSAGSPRWWLHVDLDVLDPLVFAAQGLPGVDDDPGGLSWEALTQLATAAVSEGGCLGVSLAIYDPEQDADGADARAVVALVAAVVAAWRA